MFLLGDMLARIQNGLLLRRHSVVVLRSRFCLEVLKVLYKDGFINGYAVSELTPNLIIVFLKYTAEGAAVFQKFKLLSSPSRSSYVSSRRLTKVLARSGVFFISTSRFGVISTFQINNFLQLTNDSLFGGKLLFEIIL